MKKLWAFIRHQQGIVLSTLIASSILMWVYGCPSTVVSIHNPPEQVTRGELEVEVDHFLRSAELRFADLNKQDEFKRTIFAAAMEFMSEGKINPVAIVITLGNILGLGAVVDNVRKRTLINTLKGSVPNGREKDDTS